MIHTVRGRGLRPARVKRSGLSIRARVTAAATAAVALVLIAGGMLTVATFADRERSSLDRELERRAQGPAGGPGARGREARGPSRWRRGSDGREPAAASRDGPACWRESGSFVRVVSDGHVLRAAGDVPDEGLPAPQRPGLRDGRRGGGKWRTLTIELRLPPGFAGRAPSR